MEAPVPPRARLPCVTTKVSEKRALSNNISYPSSTSSTTHSTANTTVLTNANDQAIRNDTHASLHRRHVDNRIQHLRPHSCSRCRSDDHYRRRARVPHAHVSNGVIRCISGSGACRHALACASE